jgi:hypothetical protein
MRENCGFGFVSFVSNLQVKRIIKTQEFKALVMSRLTPELRQELNVLQWHVRQAPASTDVIWENMQQDDFYRNLKSWVLLFALLVLCILFLTPMTLVDQLSPIINSYTKDKSDFFAVALQNFFAPLLILTFNSGILPTIIDFIAYLEGHKTKGAR